MSQFENVHALVVDDNSHMRRIISTMLRGFGINKVYEAADGADAFEVLKGAHVDIVFVDYMMTPLDGIDFTRLVRNSTDLPNRFVPIVMITAHTERRNILMARDAGITEFCRKPVSAKDLLLRIRAIIEQPRPFVRTKRFLGPDRRRRDTSIDGALRKRGSDQAVS